MLNSTSAPEILKENIVDNFLGSSIIQLSQKEPLFYLTALSHSEIEL